MIQRRYVRNFGESKRAARGDDVGGFVAAGEKNPIKQIAHFKKTNTKAYINIPEYVRAHVCVSCIIRIQPHEQTKRTHKSTNAT